ncbi:MAG: hypothetical protein WBW61_07325 [Rhodanobacteraceae bacterium]
MLTVVPGQQYGDEKSDAQGDDQHPFDAVGPSELRGDDVDALQQGKGEGHIGQRPLHQFALL